MAYSAFGQSPGQNEDGYTQGSDVPPPPTYEEAIGMILLSGSARTPQQTGPYPMSRVDKYMGSRLFPLMTQVKAALQAVMRQLKFLEDCTTLGLEIKAVKNKSYCGMVAMSCGSSSDNEGDILSPTVMIRLRRDPTFKRSRLVKIQEYPELHKFFETQEQLRRELMKVREWLIDQLQQDKDWNEKTSRIPTISDSDVKQFDSSLMKVSLQRSSIIEEYRRSHPGELSMVEYAIDMMLKMDMENLWSFLVRIADFESGQENDKPVPSAPLANFFNRS